MTKPTHKVIMISMRGYPTRVYLGTEAECQVYADRYNDLYGGGYSVAPINLGGK